MWNFFSINIANFEAFLLVFKLTKNLFFLKSANGSRIYLLVLHFVKYGDRYITSQILMENHLAGCFEDFMCQQIQMAPTAQLYSWQIAKVYQNIQMILLDNSRIYITTSILQENSMSILMYQYIECASSFVGSFFHLVLWTIELLTT